MSFLDQLKWSLRHFKRQLVESFLIILAIALGVAVIVTVLTLFLSAGRQFSAVGLEDYFRTFQVVSKLEGTSRETPPLVLIGSEGLPDRDWETTLGEIEELQNNLPPDMHVFVETIWLVQTPLLQETEREEDNDWFGWTEGNSIFLTGTTQRYFSFKEMSLHSGNWFLAEDVENQNKVVIITSQLAARLFGEEEPLGKTLPIKAGEDLHGEYLVIGVLDPPPEGEQGYSAFRGGNMGYVPLTASPYWPGAGRGPAQSFNHVSIGVDAGADLLQAHRRLADEARFLWGEEVVVQSPLQEYREMQRSIQQYALLIGAFASLGLVIAVINILNLMLARVLKRTKFIGLSLALGSSRRMVFGQFVLEALALGIIGSLLGVLVSFGFGALLGKTLGTVLTETMSGVRLLLGVSIGLAVSLFFGVYPAYLGSRINPGDALRSD